MTAPAQTPPRPAAPSVVGPDGRGGVRSNTPERLRTLALLTSAAIILTGVLTWILADGLVDETERVAGSTGEVLVVNQQVDASFAEAHAAAVSVHLAGADGDREQRRLYEQAIERAAAGLEQVAAVVGDDGTSHAALEQVAALTTRYVSRVESARSAAIADDASGDSLLADATTITRDQITPQVRIVTERFQANLEDQTGTSIFWLTFLAFAAVLGLLAYGQLWLFRRFRRIVNPPLFLATLVVLVWIGYSAGVFVQQQQALGTADDDAYASIEISGRIQDLAFEQRAGENTRVLAESVGAVPDVAIEQITTSGGLLDQAAAAADSNRERAMVDEVRVRWDRYVEASGQVDAALRAGRIAEAEEITSGQAAAAFNGFNASAEALLLDNREQFAAEVDFAVDVVRWLRLGVILTAVLAAVLAWWGYSIRRQEYR